MTEETRRAAKSRQSNQLESALLSVSERILETIKTLYNAGEQEGPKYSIGLVAVGDFLSKLEAQLKTPRFVSLKGAAPPKIYTPPQYLTVMLVGNHSSGKSSFINWYVGGAEPVQKTGEAAETTGFYFVQHGKKRKSIEQHMALGMYPKLNDGLKSKYQGIEKYFHVEIVPERNRSFPCVDFVDTPGLTDGKEDYGWELTDVLPEMAELQADLVLCFLDPRGQALCERMMVVLTKMYQRFPEKVKLFMSRADEVATERDRNKCSVQTVAELTRRVGRLPMNHEMPCIYIPDVSQTKAKIENAIFPLCKEIDKLVETKVQRNIEQFCEDHSDLLVRISEIEKKSSANARSSLLTTLWSLLIFMMVQIVFVLGLVASMMPLVEEHFADKACKDASDADAPSPVIKTTCQAIWFAGQVGAAPLLYTSLGGLVPLLLLRLVYGSKKALSKVDSKKLTAIRVYMKETLESKKVQLTEDLRNEAMNENR